MKTLGTLGIIIALTLFATPALALKIYKLQGNQYAIICQDGTGYSFSGTANGAQEAGALLCDEHGGIANINNTLNANQAVQKMEMDRKRPGGRLEAGKEYIHKPDSTMYHPPPGAAAAASSQARYIHKPDSTMYHPQQTGAAAPAFSGAKYEHLPDSTMYRPSKK